MHRRTGQCQAGLGRLHRALAVDATVHPAGHETIRPIMRNIGLLYVSIFVPDIMVTTYRSALAARLSLKARNASQIDLRTRLWRMCGVNFTRIDGIDVSGALPVVGVVGTDMCKCMGTSEARKPTWSAAMPIDARNITLAHGAEPGTWNDSKFGHLCDDVPVPVARPPASNPRESCRRRSDLAAVLAQLLRAAGLSTPVPVHFIRAAELGR